ncbi:hypothetical protein D9M71_666060 [compost metagenome]
MGGQHGAQCARGQRHEDQFAGLKCCQKIGDRLHFGMHLDALEVARVFTAGAHRLGLFGVAHPLPYAKAVFGQQVRHGGTETPPSQNCNRLLFSHIQSIKTIKSGDALHYTARCRIGQWQ